jgi:DNA-binding CsgD family transcriptional regulator/tetratricopeptide (TPR) repeat protein
MATFDAASDAVTAAVAVQRMVSGTRRAGADAADLQVRIGVAAGDVSWEDGDCFGLPVVVAARLEDEAEGGQILVSHVVRWLAGDRAGASFVHLGHRELRGIDEALEVFEVAWEPVAEPPAEEETSVDLPSALAMPSTIQFVGRSQEWAELAEAWADVRAGGSRVALIGGEAGAGKTRLAVEFALDAHEQGAAVLFGACDSELSLPYQPWVQALDHLLRAVPDELLVERLRPDLSVLLLLLPRLDRSAPELVRPSVLDPDADQFRLFGAVDAVLAEAATRRPVVLLLDDLHWAETQTLALLRHLARYGTARGILVIGTYRDTSAEITEPLASCLADLRRLDDAHRIRLEGLDEDNVERFLVEATGHPLDDDLRRLAVAIAERSAGNAFYVGELWRHLVSTGAVTRAGSHWVVRADIADMGVPRSVKEVVGARLDRLGPPARALIELAAVAGPRVELQVLQLAADLPLEEIGPGLDELVEAGLLADAGEVLLTYQFPHALVRDTVEDAVSPMERAQLHLRVAEALELVHEADRRPVLAELARHFTAGASLGGSAKARYYLRRAGAQALRSSAFDLAISHLTTAMMLCPPGDPERVELMLDRATAEVRDGRLSDSLSTCAVAFADARRLDDAGLMARAAIGFEQAVHMPGLPGEPAVTIVTEALERLGDEDELLHTRLHASLARALSHAGRSDEALAAVEVALSLARSCGDQEALGAALEAALVATTDPNRLLILADELERLATTSADPWHTMYATSNRLRALISFGRIDEAETVLARHQEISARGRFAAFQFVGWAFEVALALARGRFAEAEAAAEQAHAFAALDKTPFDAGVYGLQMFAIRREQGRLGEVAPVLQLVAARDVDQPLWRPGLAALYGDLDMLDEARVEFEQLAADNFASVPRDSVWPACATFLAEVCLRLGDTDRAAVLYDDLVPFSGRNLMVGMTICFGPADRFLGGLAALLGRHDDAAAHYEAASDLADRSGSPVWTAHVLHDQAAHLASRGDGARAVELGTQAHQLAVVLDMQGLAAEPIPGLASEGDDDGVAEVIDLTAVTLPDGLSAREVDVLRLVADGCSNREVGEALFISQNTVANHVRAILQKTGCANRAEAAVYAARHQLLEL